ncbi:hypothetical protein GCK72_022616 [Caenorhabditis remanei]|uniref:Uncharacterized protein n=1 Tax=Caenorhabditis remanei TaxID=31234 RepID=A0A6A5FUE5_CAERE|nr:hypothetical protein GCK72_022616 [Caenorhabditis remanei]KAF1746163.1 hypothetical protein GCK72_022616 [Caenorhabditis remanei]
MIPLLDRENPVNDGAQIYQQILQIVEVFMHPDTTFRVRVNAVLRIVALNRQLMRVEGWQRRAMQVHQLVVEPMVRVLGLAQNPPEGHENAGNNRRRDRHRG